MRTHEGDRRRGRSRWIGVVLIMAVLVLSGCSATASTSPEGANVIPAKVEAIPDQAVKKVTFTEQAAQRINVGTVAVAVAPATLLPAGTTPSPSMTVVPYSAIVYGPDGLAWVYTVPEPLTYVRAKVVVETVGGSEGTEAVLSDGPPVGTTVVKTGVIELYGTELGIGE